MRYLESRPSADLASCVHCIWELDADADALAEPIFPDGRVEVVVHLADRPTAAGSALRQPDVMVVGQMTAALRLQHEGRLHAVGVRFTPAGARAWLAAPAWQLTDRIHSLHDLNRLAETQLREAVHAGMTPHARVDRIERVLRTTLRKPLCAPRAVEHAIAVTLARAGRVTVDALARTCGLSARQMERQYLDAVGLTPKAFARTVRFQHALRLLQRGLPAAAVATECGFADQAHLAREFRRFAGVAARDVNLTRVAFLQDAPSPAVAD